jgi:hypothetical protein
MDRVVSLFWPYLASPCCVDRCCCPTDRRGACREHGVFVVEPRAGSLDRACPVCWSFNQECRRGEKIGKALGPDTYSMRPSMNHLIEVGRAGSRARTAG